MNDYEIEEKITMGWETIFGILCFVLVAVNIGFCLFDNEA